MSPKEQAAKQVTQATAGQPAAPGLRVVRAGPVSFRMRRRVTGLVLGALALALAMGAWSLTLGSYPLSLPEVYQVLTGAGSGAARFIILDLRSEERPCRERV